MAQPIKFGATGFGPLPRMAVALVMILLLFSAPAARPQERIDSSRVARDIRSLEPDKPIERELKGGEVHAYQITLAANQYLHVVVDQRGIDLVATLSGPNGKPFIEFDCRRHGPEPVSLIAKASGTYTLKIRTLAEMMPTASYKLSIKELREATPQDEIRIAAERASTEAKKLQAQGTMEDLRKAIEKFEQTLQLWRAAGDRVEEARTLNIIGQIYYSWGELQKAFDYYEQALSLSRVASDWREEAVTLNNIGLVYDDRGEKQKALHNYEQALARWRAVTDRRGEGITLKNIGLAYYSVGEYQKAVDYFDQALALFRSVGSRDQETGTLHNLGAVYAQLGDNQKALSYYNEALQLAHVLKDPHKEAETLNNLGAVYHTLGEIHKALDYYNQALPSLKAVGDRYGEASTLHNIGMVHHLLGEPQKALDYFVQSLPLSRAINDRSGEATTLSSIGEVYYVLGESQKALDYLDQALSLLHAIGDRAGEAAVLNNIGHIYSSLGEHQKALDYLSQALPLRRDVGERQGEAYTLIHLGKVYFDLGEKQKALDHLYQALPLTRAVGDRTGEAHALSTIGLMYAALGEKQKTLEHYVQALQLNRMVGDRHSETQILYNLARVQRDYGNLAEARSAIETALAIIDSLRTKVASQELRASYFASKQNVYAFYIDLLMRLHRQFPSEGHHSAALQANERARARSLLEILTEARANIRQGINSTLLANEYTLQQRLNVKAERFTKLLSGQHTNEDSVAAKKELDALLAEYQGVQTRIRVTSPHYAALTQPQPLSVKEIQEQLLDDGTLLLEYSLGEERSFLWAVTPTAINSFELPKRAEIDSLARHVYDLLTARNQNLPNETEEQKEARIAQADNELLEASATLGRILLEPVAELLGNRRLLIVSDGALQYIPFGALPVPSVQSPVIRKQSPTTEYRLLAVDHEIVSIPSASVLAVLRKELAGRKPAAKTVAVMADPVFASNDPRVKRSKKLIAEKKTASEQYASVDSSRLFTGELERALRDINWADTTVLHIPRLIFSRREAEGIMAQTSGRESMKALDFAANRATATSAEMSNYRMVHFATHGLLNSEHPELSGIVLSLVDENGNEQDGFLRLHEIYNLNLPADLVVLSACQTALGKEIKGEGLVGLTRGFMYAGAARVVASLWNVQDDATAELMKRFYKKMLGAEKLRPAAALRTAQVEMWKTKRWQAPYYWAAFVLQGEWR